jgi:hypothetical protein
MMMTLVAWGVLSISELAAPAGWAGFYGAGTGETILGTH